jgi:hypothetical protein
MFLQLLEDTAHNLSHSNPSLLLARCYTLFKSHEHGVVLMLDDLGACTCKPLFFCDFSYHQRIHIHQVLLLCQIQDTEFWTGWFTELILELRHRFSLLSCPSFPCFDDNVSSIVFKLLSSHRNYFLPNLWLHPISPDDPITSLNRPKPFSLFQLLNFLFQR